MAAGRQYRLLRELGSGTFGTVYEAEMQSVGGFRKRVALKVLHPAWEQDTDAARRFRDEARLLGRLQHRHILKVDGMVRFAGNRWALVMEYVPGCDGSTVIKACRKAREAFPVPAALEITAAVASAIDAAYHAELDGEPLRVVHRDIKPSNLRITRDGDLKVLDFGIARAEFRGREAITQRIRYGSVRYMAPERRASQDDGLSSDVYSLGCVLYEMLVGRPFGNAERQPEDHAERIDAAMHNIMLRLPDEIGERIVTLLREMLAFEPEQRPAPPLVEARARRLARQATGLDLVTFARMFIPRVYQHVPDPSLPVERVVSLDEPEEAGLKRPSTTRRLTPVPTLRRRAAPSTASVVLMAASLALVLLITALELASSARPMLAALD